MIKRGLSTDTEIWNAFRQGSEEAYELIFKENYAILVNYGLKLSSDREEVKDCVQQLFLSLWDSRSRLGENNFIKGYLFASLRRAIIRKAKKKVMVLDLQAIQPKFMLNLSVENHFLRNQIESEQAEMMIRLLDTLPARQKEALYLRFYEEQSFSEIAVVMGITKRVVYKLIYKALAKLGEQLEGKQEVENLALELSAS